MRGVVIHAPKDLRIEEPDQTPGTARRARQIKWAASAVRTCTTSITAEPAFIRIREPMVLGHEVAGVIAEVGGGVSHVAVGAGFGKPSRHCGHCRYCEEGLQNHCQDMRFIGSAMRFPHVQGGFRETLVVDESQAIAIADTLTMAEASMAEPLAVGLHAVHRAGSLVGKRVLVIGCGPIGSLVIMAARHAGAEEIIATDVQAFALDMARKCGADIAINVTEEPNGLADLVKRSGPLDVIFEASGNAAALRAAIELLRSRGLALQLGPRRRNASADQRPRHPRDRTARNIPLHLGIRPRRRPDEPRADRVETADYGDRAVHGRSRGIPTRRRRSRSTKVLLSFA